MSIRARSIRTSGPSTLPQTTPKFELTAKQKEANALLAGPQRHTLLVGGSRSGKTFLLCRAVVVRAHKYPYSRHIILRQRGNAVKNSIFLDTMPKVFRLCFPEMEVREERALQRWVLPHNGAEIWTGGLDDNERVEKILGTEYATIYFNECSQIPFASIETALSRLAQTNADPSFVQRCYYDLNPAGNRHWTYRMFIEHKHPTSMRPHKNPEQYRWMKINPSDNAINLSAEYLQELQGGSDRMRKRFFEGEFVTELDGALWNSTIFDRGRVDPISPDTLNEYGISRVVIGVDPSGTAGGETSNAVGIVVMGKQAGSKGRGFVLQDATINAHPKQWAKVISDLYDKWSADAVIAESNFGGEMVRHTIKTANEFARVKMVTASKGKHIRAEPIAALYEEEPNSTAAFTGRIHHAGNFSALEDELCNMSTNGYHGIGSPNRLDALVWAATDLFGKSVVSGESLISSGNFARFPREVV